jgi:hypothetical protein
LGEDESGATDEDMMQKAMRRNAVKNLDPSGMKSFTTAFIKFSDSKISSNLSSLGVSMGRKLEDIAVSANVLRHLEYDRPRLRQCPKLPSWRMRKLMSSQMASSSQL